jgi:hypothetical protein
MERAGQPFPLQLHKMFTQYSWLVPSTITGRAKVRVSRNGFNDMSDSSFAIIGVPTGLAVAWACPDSLRLSWNAVTSAAGYTIYKLEINTWSQSAHQPPTDLRYKA